MMRYALQLQISGLRQIQAEGDISADWFPVPGPPLRALSAIKGVFYDKLLCFNKLRQKVPKTLCK
jgi:hypothetical protein